MDVLNSVKKAEAEAERIETDYMEKVSEFRLESNKKMEKRRQDELNGVEGEFQKHEKNLAVELEKERMTIEKEAENSLTILKKNAESKFDKAVQVVIDKLVSR